MKSRPAKGILTAAAIAARMICNGQQVYSVSIPSFAERSAAMAALRTNGGYMVTVPTVRIGNDEICIGSESVGSGTNSSYMAWIVSTNVLAKQPRWDGISNDIPLNISKACTLVLPQVRKQFPEVRAWTVQSISLRKAAPGSFPDVWCYEFIFNEQTNAYADRVILLLDGTVVPPTIAQ